MSSYPPNATLAYLNPWSILKHLWHYRDLLLQLTMREITQRYRGTYLGVLWSFLTPLLMLLIYTFVFSIVLQAKWGNNHLQQGLSQFALTLFAGLVPFTILSEVLSQAPTLIVHIPNYVKKVVFPLELFPVVALGAAVVNSLMSLVVLLIAVALCLGVVSPMLILLPLAYLPLILLCLGLGWFLASLGVYIRDIGQSIGFIVQLLFFMSPIFYPVSAVPERFQIILQLNPLTTILEGFRHILLWQNPLPWQPWAVCTALTFILALLGFTWFMKTKSGFADVM